MLPVISILFFLHTSIVFSTSFAVLLKILLDILILFFLHTFIISEISFIVQRLIAADKVFYLHKFNFSIAFILSTETERIEVILLIEVIP